MDLGNLSNLSQVSGGFIKLSIVLCQPLSLAACVPAAVYYILCGSCELKRRRN